jgi:hypothetical protein
LLRTNSQAGHSFQQRRPARPVLTKPFCRAAKPFSPARESGRKQAPRSIGTMVKQRGSIMFAFLNLVYRAYCRARLLEIRRQYLAS